MTTPADPRPPDLTPTSTPTAHESGFHAPREAAEYSEQPGGTIGPYRLLQVVGEGGFGVVWLAEQREPIARRVALKVIKPGMDTRAVVARFEQERQALAVMDHPNVAQVYDAGATSAGRPYFVMEYVRGESITDFCDRLKLSVRDRLRLFIPVCEAVQHAHMKGVIHRDLKPSNILVSMPDGLSGDSVDAAVPKVIDFGVAKAISRALTDKTVFTEVGQIVGTPEYMSPEQADPGRIDIDTRTDVYSLGAVLYELLTGALPFDPKSLRSAGYAEIQRIIREVDPPHPSTRLSGLGDRRTGIAEKRRTRFGDLERELRRELEWIVLKAMRKSREERYRTPTDLADDIRNYLAGRPLAAGPLSAAYRVRKFVRKNRGAVTTGALIATTLVVAASVSVWFGVKESRARAREAAARKEAEEQRDVAQTVESFVTEDLLGSSKLDDVATTPLPEVFKAAAGSTATRFARQPGVEARVQRMLGQGFIAFGEPAQAEAAFRRVLELGDAAGVSDEARFKASVYVGESLYRQGKPDQAKAFLDAAIARRTAAVGPDDPSLLEIRNQLGGALKHASKWDEAEAIYTDVEARRARVLGVDHPDTLTTRHNLALVWLGRGKTIKATDAPQAQAYFERALNDMQAVAADKARTLGAENALTLESSSEVPSVLRALGRFDEARAAYLMLLPAMKKTYGDQHWRTLEAHGNFGLLCRQQEHWDEAAAVLRPTLEGYRATRGKTAGDTVTIASWLAEALEKMNRFDEAREILTGTYQDLADGSVETDRLEAQAKRASAFFERRGDGVQAEVWRKRAGVPKS